MRFSIKNFFSKRDQIRRKMRIWSQLQTKSSIENFIFCAVTIGFVVLKNGWEGGDKDSFTPIFSAYGLGFTEQHYEQS